MKYSIIKQQPYCCVPACIQMILKRRKLPIYTQKTIGYALGLSVPKEYMHLYPNARTKQPSSGYGTEIQNPTYSIQSFFQTHAPSLIETYYPVDTINHVRTFIIKHLSLEHDIIVCFNNAILYGVGDWGHVSLLSSIDKDGITLIDPDVSSPDIRNVSIEDLIQAMNIHGTDNRSGFWIIHNKK